MFKRWRPVALLAAAALAVTGCGAAAQTTTSPPPAPSTTTTATAPQVTTTTTPAPQRPLPPVKVLCSGLTDRCVPITPASRTALPPFAASACHIVDVSNWQGHPDWTAAAPHICGAIFKGGEGNSTDVDAAYNNSQLRAHHIWRAMYWFIRNVGCQTEANDIIRAAHSYGVKLVANDLESPGDNVGYGSCLPPLEKKAGLIVVDYTSPGTWSSSNGGFGAVPLWQAEYGPTLNPLWKPVVLWQCTDGHYGCVTYVPGIGYDDVSVNLGITSLGSPPPKPTDPYAIFPKAVYSFNYGIHAGERGTVERWHQYHCDTPPKRSVCESIHYHAQLLRDRLVYVAKHDGGYDKYHRGQRLKVLNGLVG